MKTLIKYITITISALILFSCSREELSHTDIGQSGYVEFIARPTSFSAIDVSSVSTKALTTTELTAAESTIYSLYFLVFGNDGNIIDSFSDLSGTAANTSKTLYHNNGNGPLTICYLANVPKTYAESLTHIKRLSDTPLPLTYDTYENTGYVGMPKIDGKHCFPMVGIVRYPETAAEDNKVTIPLKRLFAKVVVSIKAAFDADLFDYLDAPELKLSSGSLVNLPTNVLLSDAVRDDSPWVTYPNDKDDVKYFEDPIDIDFDMTISKELLSDSFTEVLTCYVPEYYLKAKDTTTDPKLKPQMFDSSKRPVHLTITGLARQSNFVDVPVKYHIYFGETATDDFDLLRNYQYNNQITISGTGEAILGTDERVEATYYNLADPNNSGTDTPANCYIIGRPGRYMIPTYKGASNEMLGGIDISKKVIHSDGKNSITNFKYHTDENGKNWITFDVNMTIENNAITALPDIEDGNTVLEFKDASNNTVWSWHLWFTSGGALGTEWGAIGTDTYQTTGALMMNRNIGAPGAGDIGMYYQWGDKDPYFTPSGKSAGYYGNVDAGSWSGDTKSVTDPCPPGYRVPSNAVWLSESSWKGTSAASAQTGVNFSYDINPNVDYPFSYYIDATTGISTAGSPDNKVPLRTRTTSTSVIGLDSKYSPGIKYKLDHEVYYMMQKASVWSNSEEQLSLYFQRNSKVVKVYQAWKMEKVNTSSGWIPNYQWPEDIEQNWTELSDSDIANLNSDTGSQILGYFVGSVEPPANQYNPGYTSYSDSAHGLQVRCVSVTSPIQ